MQEEGEVQEGRQDEAEGRGKIMWNWIVNSCTMLGSWLTTSLGDAGNWFLKSASDASQTIVAIGQALK
jgi:hypothetical protein